MKTQIYYKTNNLKILNIILVDPITNKKIIQQKILPNKINNINTIFLYGIVKLYIFDNFEYILWSGYIPYNTFLIYTNNKIILNNNIIPIHKIKKYSLKIYLLIFIIIIILLLFLKKKY